jgi:outer membrane protein assembly factor BamD
MTQMNRFYIFSLMSLLILGGCANDPDKYANKSAEELYTMAKEQLDGEHYETSAEIFDEVDRQHPYSLYATKAQLLKGYAFYMAQKYPNALAALETFLQLHPGHEDAPYAHYLRAMCYYEQIFSVLRDQKMAEQALASFEEIIRRFPDSQYSRDAKMKRDLILDHLAGQEMTVGRFYLNQDGHAAAANSFRVVLQKYQGTSHIPEALHRLVECYMALGLERESLEAAAVLGHNFPDSSWYADSFYLLKGVDLRHKDAATLSLWDKILGYQPKESS